MHPCRRPPWRIVAVLLLAACSRTPAPPPVSAAEAAKAAAEVAANKEYALYRQMYAAHSWEVAASLGDEVLKRYPATKAAGLVHQSIDDVHAKAARLLETRRLARLWEYTAVPEAGGTQYAAAIAGTPAPGPSGSRIRLVLREHPQWGRSVYLMLDNARFDCRGGCATLPVRFDDAPPRHMKATIPPTGEPALFIDDDTTFIAKMDKAQKVAIDVDIAHVGKRTVTFEVGGYDPSRLPHKHGK